LQEQLPLRDLKLESIVSVHRYKDETVDDGEVYVLLLNVERVGNENGRLEVWLGKEGEGFETLFAKEMVFKNRRLLPTFKEVKGECD
jgi:hypothetical protein